MTHVIKRLNQYIYIMVETEQRFVHAGWDGMSNLFNQELVIIGGQQA